MNKNIKKITNEVAKNITITMKKIFNQRKNAINVNIIMLTLKAIVVIKRIMNNVVAKNHANHEKMIIIFATITTIATIIKINKSLNCL